MDVKTAATAVVVASLTGILVVTGLIGVDFGGGHWDEPYNIDQVLFAVDHGGVLPRDYAYPAGLFTVLYATALPNLTDLGDHGRAFVTSADYLLRARAVLILLTALGVAATYALSRALARSRAEAVLAAALVATSWQLATHARYVAPDALTTLWCTVALACLVAARKRPGALIAGALLAGVATSTKYTAGVLLVAVVYAALTSSDDKRERLVRAALACVLFAIGFVVVTPGALFEPELILAALRFQSRTYGEGFFGYTSSGPLAGVVAVARYLTCALVSPFLAASLVVTACAGAGAVAWFRARASAVPLLFAALLLLPFLVQSTFIPRNLLPLLPVLAVLAARGAFAWPCARCSARARARIVAAAVAALVVVVAADALWLMHAAGTIRDRNTDRTLVEVKRFLDDGDDGAHVVCSPGVLAALRPLDERESEDGSACEGGPGACPPRERTCTGGPHVLAFSNELHHSWRWPAGNPFLFDRVFGPQEVSFSLYPTWLTPHIVLIDAERARDVGAHVDFVLPAESPPDLFIDDAMLRPDVSDDGQ